MTLKYRYIVTREEILDDNFSKRSVTSLAWRKPEPQLSTNSWTEWWSIWTELLANTRAKWSPTTSKIGISRSSRWLTDQPSTDRITAKVLFGRELRLPCDLEFGFRPIEEVAWEDYVIQLTRKMDEVHELLRFKLQVASNRVNKRYDIQVEKEGFKEGEKSGCTILRYRKVFSEVSKMLGRPSVHRHYKNEWHYLPYK